MTESPKFSCRADLTQSISVVQNIFFLLAGSTRVRTAFYGPAYAIIYGPC